MFFRYRLHVCLALLIACLSSLNVKSQTAGIYTPSWEHHIIAGLNIGGTSPIPLPNTIRKIYSWKPTFAPSLGYELGYRFHEKMAVAIGVGLDYKGMDVKDSVLYFPTVINVTEGGQTGTFEGTFTGRNKTEIRNAYVNIPVSFVFIPDENWRVKAGVYMAWLFSSQFSGNVSNGYIRNGGPTGEKIIVDKAEFDFGDEVRSFDFGVRVAGERRLGKKLNLQAQLNWGLRPVFPSSFKGMDFPMYNIYFQLGVSYKM
ncbi:hypothetical protein COR50_15150 [Chitinophaga caeni]|uniref:Outer membrane protein beta-barrel domain-containing protein n=1 Tax=Chitinophaga caeni TaxID=2029983 RepID=A0A291QWY2_9BACT|nr:hypothetical protein COR50_15150 [Chitinophaga caeni]